jgi:hypothetical protein
VQARAQKRAEGRERWRWQKEPDFPPHVCNGVQIITMRETVIDTETTGLDPLDGHRRARNRGPKAHLISASNQIYLVMDASTPVAPFTVKRDMQIYLRRRLETFCNPLVYTFQGGRGPSIMTLSRALAEG